MSTGTPSPKGELESSWASDISHYTPPNLDHPCTTWDNPQRPSAHTRICDIPEKGEGYVHLSFFITSGRLTPSSAALAASVVKIAGRDVLATWKILIALGVAPVLYLFYAAAATIIAVRSNASLKWRILTPFLVIISLPFMNYAALKFGEAGMDVLK